MTDSTNSALALHGPVRNRMLAFLFTDIEGSTQRWERAPAEMKVALARHDGILRQAIEVSGGQVFKTMGDAFCAAFANPSDALTAALAAQRAIAADGFAETGGLKVRMAVHVGAAEARDGDYFGQPLNRVARLLSAGHGAQVLVSDAAALSLGSLPAGSSLIGLGTHRLKDLAESEEIHQLVAPDLETTFPPLRALSMSRNNLPLQVTDFIGRESETAEIRELLQRHRLVTLVGSGGVGKTRTSLEIGADFLDRYPDGVWFVELAPLSDPQVVAENIAGFFGASIGAGRVPLDAVVTVLKDKRTLLILDNCEHLVAAMAHFAEAILRSCPQVMLMASSREPLAIAGEGTYRLPSLGFAERTAGITAKSALGYAAMRLFAQRARAAVPGFAVTDENAPAIADICRRLDGIALAIELAAPRLKIMRPQEVARRLDDRFRILTGGSRTALPRQQTLKALIDWSYNLLSEAERTLLRRLSVFAGGWTLDGATAVAAGDPLEEWEIFNLLASLVDKSLVVAGMRGSDTRYQMLESTRQYAAEKLAESREAGGERRLAEYLISLYAKATDAWPTSPTDAWLETYEPELDNLRAAVEWAFAPSGDELLGLDLVGYSKRLLFELTLFPELIRWVDRALARIGTETPPATEARLWVAKTFCIDALGNPEAAAAGTRAVALYRGLPDQQALGVALTRAGAAAAAPGSIAEAEALLRQAIAVLQPLGRSKYLAECLALTGTCLDYGGDHESSRRLLADGAAMYRALADKSGLRLALNNLAETELSAGFPDRAVAIAREVVGTVSNVRDRVRVMLTRSNLAGYLLVLGEVDEAAQAAKESLRDELSVGGRSNYVACTLQHLALVAAERRHFQRSARLFGYLAAWYGANTSFYLDAIERVSHARNSALLAASLPELERAMLMAEGAAWSEDEAAAEALKV